VTKLEHATLRLEHVRLKIAICISQLRDVELDDRLYPAKSAELADTRAAYVAALRALLLMYEEHLHLAEGDLERAERGAADVRA
jgi:hypothetical protein